MLFRVSFFFLPVGLGSTQALELQKWRNDTSDLHAQPFQQRIGWRKTAIIAVLLSPRSKP